ncbi:hypothetical protein HY086_04055 [Candidatus Gottesmanbacteria bacterium]|nr:hypothetical protein [Candidatus Gottesmanbacteria bacterium]
MPQQRKTKPATLVMGGLWVIAAILGILLFQSGAFSWPSATTKPSSYTIDGIIVKTSLSKEHITTALNFLKEALPAERLPKELTFRFAEGGNQVKGDAYVANWRQEKISLSILVGLDSKNKTVAYLRIWTMEPAKILSDQEFILLPNTVFAKPFFDTISPLACEKRLGPGIKEAMTVCSKITSAADGSLRGITVRSPVTLTPPRGTTPLPGTPPPPTVTIVSACLVTKEVAPIYPQSSCI